jgi:hypothetical protein
VLSGFAKPSRALFQGDCRLGSGAISQSSWDTGLSMRMRLFSHPSLYWPAAGLSLPETPFREHGRHRGVHRRATHAILSCDFANSILALGKMVAMKSKSPTPMGAWFIFFLASFAWVETASVALSDFPSLWGRWLAKFVITLSGLALIAAALFVLDMKKRKVTYRRSYGLCLNCGYDLRATQDQCPECGTIANMSKISN